MSDSDQSWRKWGEIDPYFGVLSNPEFRATEISRTKDKFMAEGEEYIARHLEMIEGFLGPLRRRRALDFGCGVGRLVIPLARRFEAVVGLDIAPGMLREGERNVTAEGLSNVEYKLSDDELSNAVGTFDFVHTYIVMQHIPVRRGMQIIGQLLARVGSKGVISLHVNLDRGSALHHRAVYWARTRVPLANAALNLARGRPMSEPYMQMNEYSLSAVLQNIAARGFGPAVVRLEDHGLCRTAQIVARRTL